VGPRYSLSAGFPHGRSPTQNSPLNLPLRAGCPPASPPRSSGRRSAPARAPWPPVVGKMSQAGLGHLSRLQAPPSSSGPGPAAPRALIYERSFPGLSAVRRAARLLGQPAVSYGRSADAPRASVRISVPLSLLLRLCASVT